MGVLFLCWKIAHHIHTTMKVFLLVALAIAAVVAEPEADADAYYGYYGYGVPRGFGYARAYGYGRYHKALGIHPLGKREAEPAHVYYGAGYYGLPVKHLGHRFTPYGYN